MACSVQGTPKNARQVKKKVRSMLIILFDNKGIVHKKFVLAGQTINSTHYCDVLQRLRENMQRLRPELWLQKNWLLHHNASSYTSSFTREFLTKYNTTVVTYPTYLSLFPGLKINLKGRHFDTVEVIETELQEVVNSLTEHNFQDAFQKMAEALGTVHTLERGLLRG
jgi:hypothetical protein